MLADRVRARNAASYAIENSCTFDGSTDFFSRTFSAGDDLKTFSFATWFKRSSTGVNSWMFSASGDDWIGFLSSNKLGMNAGASNYRILTNATYGASTWFHCLFVWDTSNATAGDRMRLYVDGVEITSFTTDTNPPQNQTVTWNTAVQHNIGKLIGAGQYFHGLMADVHFIDGLALGPSSFLSNGSPKRYTGAYGTNGFKLDFTNSGALGTDVSGNGNNFTVNGTPAQSTDVPT